MAAKTTTYRLSRMRNGAQKNLRRMHPRTLANSVRTSMRRRREHLPNRRHIDGTWQLFTGSLAIVRQRKRLFALVLTVFLVLSWAAAGIPRAENYQLLRDIAGNDGGPVTSVNAESVSALALGIVGGVFEDSVLSELGQFLLFMSNVLLLLVTLWIARQMLANKPVNLRQALYNAPAALVPFTLVGAVFLAAAVPGALGIVVLGYSLGLEVSTLSGVQAVGLSIAASAMIAVSLWLIARLSMALIIVALPNTYPLQAIKAAWVLARDNSMQIVVRFLGLLLLCALSTAIILAPFIVGSIYQPVVFSYILGVLYDALGVAAAIIAALYFYRIYRSLL